MGAVNIPPRERPGCITALAILYWVSGAFYVIGGIATGVLLMVDGGETAVWGLVSMFCIGLFAFLPIGFGIGLWQMKKWAWWIMMVVEGISLFGVVANLCLIAVAQDLTYAIITLVTSLFNGVIHGGIFYWFYTNQGLFEPSYFRDKEGKVYTRPVKGTDNGVAIAILVAGLGLLCVIPIIVIAVLTLMGPQIGDVFSQIIIDLESR